MKYTTEEQATERADVQSRANQLVELGYISTAQKLVNEYNHKYKLGQYADPITPEQATTQNQQHVQNQQKADRLIRRIYTEYYDDLDQKAQNPPLQNQIVTGKSMENVLGNSNMVNMMDNPLAQALNKDIQSNKKTNTTPSGAEDRQQPNSPRSYWVNDKQGNFLFRLNNPQAEQTDTIIARQLYDKGLQWFAPTAENYVPIDSVNPNLRNNPNINHVNSEEFRKFAYEPRLPISYAAGGSGDWKKHKGHGNGSLLSEVNGKPIWTDALGQIPYAIGTYRWYLQKYGDPELAKRKTIENGYTFGDGNLLNILGSRNADRENNYDNYLIKKTVEEDAARSFKFKKSRNYEEQFKQPSIQTYGIFKYPMYSPYTVENNEGNEKQRISILDDE